MTSQTVKHAKLRAAVDPDREDGPERECGVYYGANVPYRVAGELPLSEFVSVMTRHRTTRGACH